MTSYVQMLSLYVYIFRILDLFFSFFPFLLLTNICTRIFCNKCAINFLNFAMHTHFLFLSVFSMSNKASITNHLLLWIWKINIASLLRIANYSEKHWLKMIFINKALFLAIHFACSAVVCVFWRFIIPWTGYSKFAMKFAPFFFLSGGCLFDGSRISDNYKIERPYKLNELSPCMKNSFI